jgi:ubiquinone/menaquinone biosynthesis C-methylase UbiE
MKDQLDLSKMESVPKVNNKGYLRLHRYWSEPNKELWDNIWKNTKGVEYWEKSLNGYLIPDYKSIFLKYLKKGDKVLEAGSGVGQVVLALRALHYDCYGLDYAEETINLLKKKFPKVPFVLGDIRTIPFEDGFFDSYISLGVIEHFTSGQLDILKEASRVLKEEGIIFLTVPFLNSFRKLNIKSNYYHSTDFVSKFPYFEACFSQEELSELFQDSGFEILEYKFLNPIMPLVQESFLRPFYYVIEDKPIIRSIIDKILNLVLPKKFSGHMVMIVARKIKR